MKYIVIALIMLLHVEVHAESVTVTWDNPTTNDDGSPIENLSGVKLYYATSANYPTFTMIDVGYTSCYVLRNLSVTGYYIKATAYNTSAMESVYSNQVYKNVSSGHKGSCFKNISSSDNKVRGNVSGGFGGGFR
ncbi:MAG: hypothetical protein A2W23_03165 [Planctomycetes bacterium RBG_16_43_13]|nr:MAG: hypothetical protein A2W23_03165 [Planctomycetes bacterium RBG_16_43_13]